MSLHDCGTAAISNAASPGSKNNQDINKNELL